MLSERKVKKPRKNAKIVVAAADEIQPVPVAKQTIRKNAKIVVGDDVEIEKKAKKTTRVVKPKAVAVVDND